MAFCDGNRLRFPRPPGRKRIVINGPSDFYQGKDGVWRHKFTGKEVLVQTLGEFMAKGKDHTK